MTDTKITKKDQLVSAVLMCLGLAVTAAYIYLKPGDLMDASVSGDLLLGNYLNTNGGLYTTAWYYGRSPLIVNIQILYKLLLRFLPVGFRLVRVISAVIFAMLMAGSYIFMMSECGMKREGLLSAGVFMLPFGHWYAKFCLFGGERAIYVFAAFLSMGLVFMGMKIREFKRERLKGMAVLVIGCAAAFLTGLDSSLMFRVFYLPLFVAALIMAVSSGKKGFSLFSSGVMLAASFAANVLSNAMIKPWFICEDPVKDKFVYLFKEGFFDKLYDAFNFFGWIRGASIMSLNGVLNALAPLMSVLVIFSIVRVGGRFKRLKESQQFLWVYSLCAFFTGALIFSSTPDYDYQDWIVILVFFAAVTAIEFSTEELSFFTAFKGFALPAVYICLILLSISEFISPKTDANGYTVKLEDAAGFLVSNGYDKGFAPYDWANILSESSDGELDTYAVSGMESLAGLWENWNLRQRDQAVEHMSVKPEGKFFILVPHDREYDEGGSILSGLEESRIFADDSCEIYGFGNMEEYEQSVKSLRGE